MAGEEQERLAKRNVIDSGSRKVVLSIIWRRTLPAGAVWRVVRRGGSVPRAGLPAAEGHRKERHKIDKERKQARRYREKERRATDELTWSACNYACETFNLIKLSYMDVFFLCTQWDFTICSPAARNTVPSTTWRRQPLRPATFPPRRSSWAPQQCPLPPAPSKPRPEPPPALAHAAASLVVPSSPLAPAPPSASFGMPPRISSEGHAAACALQRW